MVGVGGDSAHLSNRLGIGAGSGQRLDFLDRLNHGLVDARLRSMGFMPAATDFRPSFTMA